MYRIQTQKMSQAARLATNKKILAALGSGSSEFSAETVYNTYTGHGGLHALKQGDFASYFEYAEAKREQEMGQFFTPHEICRTMVDAACPQPTDMVLDMCCGMGNFFNFLPNPYNAYGFDIDPDAVNVARFLYPNAHISVADIRTYEKEERFDILIGNPPFNLDFDGIPSQFYYCNKAYWMLNPAGLLLLIVPATFLKDEFWDKTKINTINRDFSFIGQTELPSDAFKRVGVAKFDTKIMAFLRASKHIGMHPYRAEEFCTMEQLKERIAEGRGLREEIKLQLHQEVSEETMAENRKFEYRLKKYLYEIKTHKALQKHYDKSIALVSKFRNQRPPQKCTVEEYKAWERRRLTYNKVLGILRRYIRSQNIVPRKEVALVKTSYGFKLKAYAPHLLDRVEHTYSSINDILIGEKPLPALPEMTPRQQEQYAMAERFIAKKRRAYRLQSVKFSAMQRDTVLDGRIATLNFLNKDMQTCRFTALQQHDMELVFQKRYVLLNWQQGSGKTAVAYHYAKFREPQTKNTVVLAPSIAIHMTWEPFLQRHGEPFVTVSRPEHLKAVVPGMFVLVSLTMLGDLKAAFKTFMKRRSNKICLIFDESDEITNPYALRTRLTLDLFRRSEFKLLATGTTTRNSIVELYPQLELMYNNSVNMICYAPRVYFEDKEHRIAEKYNEYCLRPFPARSGAKLFRASFCPGKATVFGIEKHNQDIYNQSHLSELIDKTIITRKFKEFAGDKYEIINYTVKPGEGERAVYRTIMEKFHEILHLYFNPMKDKKKESHFKIARQIQLLIKACSVPHRMSGYHGDPYPEKAKLIGRKLRFELRGKVAIGCTSLDAVAMYEEFLKERFPQRPLFVIRGDVGFKTRQRLLDKFEKTKDGILVCTQQSLRSSVNVPSCEDIVIESLLWNIPRMEQFYFRFIRLDSEGMRHVYYITYEDSIEQNLMALVLAKERLNEFVKNGKVTEESDIFEEFDISPDIIETLFRREKDDKGNFHICWGAQKVS